MTTNIAGYAVDSLCGPIAGYIMDSRGRRCNGIVSNIVTAFAFCLLAVFVLPWVFTSAVAVRAVALGGVAVVMGLGNGLSTGLVLTMGSDLACVDPTTRSQFLSLYRLVSDIGTLLGPPCAGIIAGATSLTTSSLVMAAFGLVTAAWMAFVVPETKGIVARMHGAMGTQLLTEEPGEGARVAEAPAMEMTEITVGVGEDNVTHVNADAATVVARQEQVNSWAKFP